ncbi:MAG: hypothetical protein V1881_00755, partial [Candidatus Micrarchaeota archaeon]
MKIAHLLLLLAVAPLAFAADAQIVLNPDISPPGGFDSVNNAVTISLARQFSGEKAVPDVAQATILVKGSKFDNTCFKAELKDVLDASGKKVIDKKLTITYYTTCQTCESDNHVQIALTTALDKPVQLGFKTRCDGVGMVFVSNGDVGSAIKSGIVKTAAAMRPLGVRVKYLNLNNEAALSDGDSKPFAEAAVMMPSEAELVAAGSKNDWAEQIRQNRIAVIKSKLMAGAPKKTLIIVGNAPPTSAGGVIAAKHNRKPEEIPLVLGGFFPLFRKKFAGAEIPSKIRGGKDWEYEVPIDRLYDPDFAAVADSGSFASADLMTVSRLPGYPDEPALTVSILNRFAAKHTGGTVSVSGEPLVIADNTVNDDNTEAEIAKAAKGQAEALLGKGFATSDKYKTVPKTCLTPAGTCDYPSLQSALQTSTSADFLTHGYGEGLSYGAGNTFFEII